MIKTLTKHGNNYALVIEKTDSRVASRVAGYVV